MSPDLTFIIALSFVVIFSAIAICVIILTDNDNTITAGFIALVSLSIICLWIWG